MWHFLKDIWAHNRLALLAFVAVVAIAGYFGVRAAGQFIYWADPAHQDQPLAGWMTPRYVSRSYDVPPPVILDALEMDREAIPRRASLDTIAAEQDMTLDEMQLRVETAVTAWRTARSEGDQ